MRRRPPDDERHHHVREDDDVAERDDRERFVDFQRGVQIGYTMPFSMSVIGLSFAITTSRVIVTSRSFFWFGT